MNRRAFTLIEMLMATVLAAVLLGGVLMVVSAISRDAASAAAPGPQSLQPAVRLLEWDLSNAATMQLSDDGQSFTLVGNDALDPETLSPTGRMARVVYQIDPQAHTLAREQRYVDDDIRPEPWIELVANGVTRIDVSSPNTDIEVDASGNEVIPRNVVVSLERAAADIVTEVRPR